MTSGISRREFLKIGAAGAAASVLAGCQSPRRWVTLEPYVRSPEEQLAGVATWYASTCRQCPAGCGIVVRVMNGRALKIEGNPEHPLNQGKLCARGQAGLQLLYNPDRLPGPVRQARRGARQFERLAWNEAINLLYTKIQEASNQVAVWASATSSGHLLDLFQRFTTAIGAPVPVVFDLYIALNSYALAQTSSRDLFGHDALPAYNLGQADVVLSFGANLLGAWLSAVRYGVEYGQFRSQMYGKRGYLVQFESRMSITGAKADHWLPIRPGTEALVAQALLRLIADQSLGPPDRLARAKELAGSVDIDSVAAASDISSDELARLARLFVVAEHPLAIPGPMLAGQENGSAAIAAVQSLNLLAGTGGQAGGLTLSPGAPLPAPAKTAPSTFADAQSLIQQMQAGEVQVLLIHGANPVYDLPQKAGFTEALTHVPLVVSFSPLVDETAAWADLILPDRTYLESWGYEVVSPDFGLPVISSQQPVVKPVFEARATADILLTIVRGLPAAAKALPWSDEVAYLKEIISQLPHGVAGGSGPEVLWSRFLQHGGWWLAEATALTPAPVTMAPALLVSSPTFQGDEQEYPYFLHLYLSDLLSDGRGASQPWLQGSPDPMTTIAWQTWVEFNPTTAQKLGLQDGDVVQVISPHGQLEAPVYIYPAIRPDTVAIPLGQGHTDYSQYARDRGSNPMRLVGPETDSTGSDLAWAAVRVKISLPGQRGALAALENKDGVTEGFINQAFPGR